MVNKIKYLVVDVDGTMTDAGIYYDENGNELKKFCVRDAVGFFVARQLGIKILVLTGRQCMATKRRMEELKVDYLFQNVKKKKEFLEEFIQRENIKKENIGYIGDDLNDYESMKIVGFVACPSDACREVLKLSNYISKFKGGEGVIRDVVEHILDNDDIWKKAIKEIY